MQDWPSLCHMHISRVLARTLFRVINCDRLLPLLCRYRHLTICERRVMSSIMAGPGEADTHRINIDVAIELARRGKRREGPFNFRSFEDSLVDILCDGSGKVPVSKIIAGLRNAGLYKNDPRLKESMDKLQKAKTNIEDTGSNMVLDKETFKDCIKDNLLIIRRAFTADFVVPEFKSFCSTIEDIYNDCKDNNGGQPATYIPQLARYDPNLWGVSICTTDGQRHAIGDVNVPFSIQSCSKPLNYALALHENGADYVHQYVGHEPSGESFNHIKLSSENKPHNPMINAGAITTASLIKNKHSRADRFDYAIEEYRRLAGYEHVAFNNAVFLSERDTADRNFALGYYLKENKCFPEGVDLLQTLDFYFQLCSVEINCESGGVIAATLANGGYCPITGEKVVDVGAVRNTLSLMHSCGMYDYSGEFAFKVGLPAKSGVSGVILLVIPNVCGMCLWSPPLDKCGNSVRGIQFCEELVRLFNFHHYDNLQHTAKKMDPRLRPADAEGDQVTTLLFGASNGDLTALRRMYMSEQDMGVADYDGRTALHLAASEGKYECVKFLLEKARVPHSPTDRWDRTPMEDAKATGRTDIVQLIEKHIKAHP